MNFVYIRPVISVMDTVLSGFCEGTFGVYNYVLST